jgi:hypothetical protein
MLGTNLDGSIQYHYDTPYFPQYRPARTRQLYFGGRYWNKRMQLAPWTRYGAGGDSVTVQGDHHTVWAYSDAHGMSAVKHTTREVNAPSFPSL